MKEAARALARPKRRLCGAGLGGASASFHQARTLTRYFNARTSPTSSMRCPVELAALHTLNERSVWRVALLPVPRRGPEGAIAGGKRVIATADVSPAVRAPALLHCAAALPDEVAVAVRARVPRAPLHALHRALRERPLRRCDVLQRSVDVKLERDAGEGGGPGGALEAQARGMRGLRHVRRGEAQVQER